MEGSGGYKKKFKGSRGSVGSYDKNKRRSFDNNPDSKKKERNTSSSRRSHSGAKSSYGPKANKPGGFGRRSRS